MSVKPSIVLQSNELDEIYVDIKAIQPLDKHIKMAHRDDHYMFILQQKGIFSLEIDFREIELNNSFLCFVAPGQVHRYLEQQDNTGWFVFVNPELVLKQYRDIFDTFLHMHQSVQIQESDAIFDAIPILKDTIEQKDNILKAQLLKSVIGAITGIIAARIIQSQTYAHLIGSRKYYITSQFKQLVNEKYKEYKQVKEYAGLLNITSLYLNEVIKEITGFPASYWIQQTILLEAKRLLYYTDMDVKEVAYELGNEDQTYFSRFFKKNVHMTASEFRSKNHDLSNHDL